MAHWIYTSSTRTRRGGSCLRDIYIYIYIYKRPFSSIELACAVRQPSPCVRAFCESGVLFHMSHVKLHFALHTSRCTLHTPPTHFTLHTSHFTLHISHFTLHTSQSTLHTSRTRPRTVVVVQEHDLRAIPAQRCQLSSKHFPHTSHCILQISRSTLLTCTSFQLISSEIFSSHFMSSHMSAKFFLAIFMSSERSSNFLISPKLVSTHLVPVCGKKKTTNRPQPQPSHTRGTFHRRLQPLYTEKHKVSCSGFLPKT